MPRLRSCDLKTGNLGIFKKKNSAVKKRKKKKRTRIIKWYLQLLMPLKQKITDQIWSFKDFLEITYKIPPLK